MWRIFFPVTISVLLLTHRKVYNIGYNNGTRNTRIENKKISQYQKEMSEEYSRTKNQILPGLVMLKFHIY